METSTIAITLADRSLYPLTDPSGEFYKNVVLTTANDNQPRAQIRFCRMEEGEPSAHTIGVIDLEDLPTLSHGELEIDLHLEVDSEGLLCAVATERSTGRSSRLTIPLHGRGTNLFNYTTPVDSSFESSGDIELGTEAKSAPNPEAEQALYEPLVDDFSLDGDSSPSRNSTDQETRGTKKWLVLLLLFLLILLGIGGLWWFLQSRSTPATQPEPPAATQPAEPVPPPVAPAVEPPAVQAEPAQPAPAEAAEPEPVVTVEPEPVGPSEPVPGFTHRIRWGDTLWHLSQRFYGTPWRYPELADYNQIPNPDLIIAGEDLVIPGEE